jgi:hypothetical protein
MFAGVVWFSVITIELLEDGDCSSALRLLAKCDVLQSKSTAKPGKRSAVDVKAYTIWLREIVVA